MSYTTTSYTAPGVTAANRKAMSQTPAEYQSAYAARQQEVQNFYIPGSYNARVNYAARAANMSNAFAQMQISKKKRSRRVSRKNRKLYTRKH